MENFSHNSTWVHTKGQNHKGRVSENTEFSFLAASCFHLLVALASEAAVGSMLKKRPHELRMMTHTFTIGLAQSKVKNRAGPSFLDHQAL